VLIAGVDDIHGTVAAAASNTLIPHYPPPLEVSVAAIYLSTTQNASREKRTRIELRRHL